ncbi:MAG: ATP-binding protein, partial [Thermodesulfobacteriota bacterium]
QVLINLLGNGIKFTEEGSVTLEVLPIARDDDKMELHFMVSDTGIGIPADKQESIFFSFNQADTSTTRQFGGSGLGLAISKQLVEMMGGRIWCESKKGEGACFHFTLILEPGEEPDYVQNQQSPNMTLKGLTILLVEDNDMNRHLARMVLEQNKHQVIEAENGLKGLELLACEEIDLILMDVQMPVMDGLTAAAIIRTSEKGGDLKMFNLDSSLAKALVNQCRSCHTPIVAMTANAMAGDREKCMAAGMDGYLTKPFEPDQVMKLIAELSCNSGPVINTKT